MKRVCRRGSTIQEFLAVPPIHPHDCAGCVGVSKQGNVTAGLSALDNCGALPMGCADTDEIYILEEELPIYIAARLKAAS